MPVVYVNSGDNVSTTTRYVALGDSIAYGYGLEDRENDSYVGQVRHFLEERYDQVILSNFGENGMRSEELLDALTNPENERYASYRATVRYADYVTLSIGSNDLLHLIKVDFDMEETVRREEANFRKACQDFSVNFVQIIEELHAINPKAKIYANNIYNPAKRIKSLESVYDVAEYYIVLLNRAFFASEKYKLADVKKTFDKQEKSMINVSIKGREIDPHPSKEGHTLIAYTVIKEMTE